MALEKWQDALDYLGHDNPFLEKDFVHNTNQDGGIKVGTAKKQKRWNWIELIFGVIGSWNQSCVIPEETLTYK
jgi:hypothetical protein